MADSANPYAAPQPLDADTAGRLAESPRLNWRLMVAWAAVLFSNLIVPMVIGLFVADPVGRWGMGIAVGMILTLGWLFCYAFPVLGRKLIAGSVVTALSQILPIVQFVAGIIGLGITSVLGLYIGGDDFHRDHFTSELGGFVATMCTGTILIVGSLVLGWLLAFLLPKRWFYTSPVPHQSI